ncbi:MAG: outer rane adhesin like protein [Planctomycetaceae bacterium]|nr:outer rane adhesin like protein [Planctomycetaceae bacterium]
MAFGDWLAALKGRFSTMRPIRRTPCRRKSQTGYAGPTEALEDRILMTVAPVAHNDSYTMDSMMLSVYSGGVLANDTDADFDMLHTRLVSGPANGMVSLNWDGTFMYMPMPGFAGSDTFTYVANDGFLDSNLATVTISSPHLTAVGDSFTVKHDHSLMVSGSGVLSNDEGTGGTMTAVLSTNPTHGFVSFNSNGSFSYTPNFGYVGADSFTYYATNGQMNSTPATVSLAVTDANPTAVNDSYTLTGPGLMVMGGGVLLNDTDADGDTLTARIGTSPAGGMVTLNSDGSFIYTPGMFFTGTDTFTYIANDGARDSSPATVTISTPRPTAVNDSYTTRHDQSLMSAISVLANDSSPNGMLSAVLATSPAHGILTLNSSGGFSYMPNAGYAGVDSFTYYANDGSYNSTTAATVAITVTDATPVTVNDSYTLTDTWLTVNGSGILANDTDADGDPLHARVITNPAHGSLSLNNDGSFMYMPGAGYTGTDSFTYVANDGVRDSSAGTVTISSPRPTATNDAYSVGHDHPLIVMTGAGGLLSNDSSPNGTLLAVLATGPSHGTLSVSLNGSFSYTPAAGYIGADSFTYYANDGSLNSVLAATVSLTVSNAVPVAVADTYTLIGSSLTVITTSGLLANDSEADGDPLHTQLVASPAHGTVTLSPDGSFVYTRGVGFSHSDSFTYRTIDSTGAASSAVTVGISLQNTAPVITGPHDDLHTHHDVPLTFNESVLLAGASDIDGDPLTIEITTDVQHGTLTRGTNGDYLYHPNHGYVNEDSFIYRVTDPAGAGSNLVTIHILVENLGQWQTTIQTSSSYSTMMDTPLSSGSGGLLNGMSDPDGDPLVVTLDQSPTHGTLNLSADGSFTYTPNSGYYGSDGFSYHVSDGVQTTNGSVSIDVKYPTAAAAAAYQTYLDQVASANTQYIGTTDSAATHYVDGMSIADSDYGAAITVASGVYHSAMNGVNGSYGSTTNAGVDDFYAAIHAADIAFYAALGLAESQADADTTAAINAYLTREGNAWNAYQTAVDNADDLYSGTLDHETSAYTNLVSAAEADFAAHIGSAYDTYTGTASDAQNLYNSTDATAYSDYQGEIDRTDAVYHTAVTSANNTYSTGESNLYDTYLAAEPLAYSAYTIAIAGANLLYGPAVAAASATYNSSLATAKGRFDTANANASTAYHNAVHNADDKYDDAIDLADQDYAIAGTNSVDAYSDDEALAWGLYRSDMGTADGTYDTEVDDAYGDYNQRASDAYGQYGIDAAFAKGTYNTKELNAWGDYVFDEDGYWTTYSGQVDDADTAYNNRVNPAYTDYRNAESGYWTTYLGKESDAETAYNNKVADADILFTDHVSTAYGTYQNAIGTANTAYHIIVDPAEAALATALAHYQSTQDPFDVMAVTQAESDLALAKSDALAAWSTDESIAWGAYWNTYNNEVATWNTAELNAYVGYQTAETNAWNVYSNAEETKWQWYQDEVIAADIQWHITEQDAWDDYQLDEALAWADYESRESTAWTAYTDEETRLWNVYTTEEADAWSDYLDRKGAAATKWTNDEAFAWSNYQSRLGTIENTFALDKTIADNKYNTDVATAKSDWILDEDFAWANYEFDDGVASSDYDSDVALAYSTYISSGGGAVLAWNTIESAAWSLYQAAGPTAWSVYQLAEGTLATNRDNAIATAETNWTADKNTAWNTYQGKESTAWTGYQGTVSGAWGGFQAIVGSETGILNGAEAGAWNSLQTNTAPALADRQHAEQLAWDDYNTEEGLAGTDLENAAHLAGGTLEGKIAAALATWRASKDQALLDYSNAQFAAGDLWLNAEAGLGTGYVSSQTAATGVWQGVQSAQQTQFDSALTSAAGGWTSTESAAWAAYQQAVTNAPAGTAQAQVAFAGTSLLGPAAAAVLAQEAPAGSTPAPPPTPPSPDQPLVLGPAGDATKVSTIEQIIRDKFPLIYRYLMDRGITFNSFDPAWYNLLGMATYRQGNGIFISVNANVYDAVRYITNSVLQSPDYQAWVKTNTIPVAEPLYDQVALPPLVADAARNAQNSVEYNRSLGATEWDLWQIAIAKNMHEWAGSGGYAETVLQTVGAGVYTAKGVARLRSPGQAWGPNRNPGKTPKGYNSDRNSLPGSVDTAPEPNTGVPDARKAVPNVEHSPYQIHIDPKTGRGPMAIDTSTFKSGEPTLYGGIRNPKAFWREWKGTYGNTLSEANGLAVKAGRSPVVDDQWIKQFPEHAPYKGETLIHHHLDYGPKAIPLPDTLHSRQPGWGIWHPEHAGGT